MIHIRLTDLDELSLTVREAKAKSYITEAVAAYRGGAYRAAIVSTWIAVTYDIISKIRELAWQGDPLARKLINELDHAVSVKDINKLQNLEAKLLDKALGEFEFLSHQEHGDLFRLKEDRNLCAHPAFVAEETLFEPEPERVRMHIVHAVRHLLQHQPVQGKSALGRLITDIKSVTFPNELETATVFLNAKYLDRAKKVLIQNLIVILLKALLRGDNPDLPNTYFSQILLTLLAVSKKYPEIYEVSLNQKLPLIVDTLEDSLLPNMFLLLGADGRCWDWIGKPSQIRLKNSINLAVAQASTRSLVFDAINIEGLKPDIFNAFDSLKQESQIVVIASNPRPEFAEYAIQIYSEATGYRNAERLGESVLIPMIKYFSANDIIKILETVKQNNQISQASGTAQILEKVFDGTTRHFSVTKNAWSDLIAFLAPVCSRYTDISKDEGWADTDWKGIVARLENLDVAITPIPSR